MLFVKRQLLMDSVVFLLAIIFYGPVSAATLNVSPGKNAIKNAISIASPGDTLLLNAGTYNEHGLIVNKTLTIIGPVVTGNNSPTAMIDAQEMGRVFTVNKRVTLTLKNLLITNGTAAYYGGGAIYNLGNLTVAKCAFTNNTVNDFTNGGGAIYSGTNVKVTNCIFTGNSAKGSIGYGGAIYINSTQGTLTVSGCTFNNNTATGYGGAIQADGTLKVTNSIFTNNTGSTGGGIMGSFSNITILISGCTFTGNNAKDGGGGAIYGNSAIVNVTHCTFTNNTAENGYRGGGAIYGSPLTVTNCAFTNNSAINCDRGGGAVIGGNAMVTNSTFTGNSAKGSPGCGGAIAIDYNENDTSTVSGCTFTNNTVTTNIADNEFGAGGAIFNWSGTVNVSDCNFTNNTATDGGAIGSIDTLQISGCTFESNQAINRGNAIYNENGYSFSRAVHFNRFYDTESKYEIYCTSDGEVDARYNWWGSNKDPSSEVYGSVTVGPWLRLKVNANPTIISIGSASKITANLCYDSDGVYHKPADGHLTDGIPVTFTTTLGAIENSASTANGKASATLNSGTTTGVAKVSASLDDQVVKKSVIINP